MSAMPTGAINTPSGKDGSSSRARSASPKGGKKNKKAPFSATSSRALQLELMGEETPGPGTYLPASTFGKFASKSDKQFSKMASPEFRSKSPQRARVQNLSVPGPGAHSPNLACIEKNRTNPAAALKAKGKRFAKAGSGDEMGDSGSAANVGPGSYDIDGPPTQTIATTKTKYAGAPPSAQKARDRPPTTIANMVANRKDRGSKNDPGFNCAEPAHTLPHEKSVEADKELPGPGKYETNTSEIALANGHSSSFKLPIEKPKLRGAGAIDLPEAGAGGKKKAGGKAKGEGKATSK